MNEQKNAWLIPAAIIIAGALIAGGIYFSNAGFGGTPSGEEPSEFDLAKNVAPISAEDHIRGSSDAPVKIIVFSDLECPFCKTFHQSMQQLMEEYGPTNQVAWVYRHFPLDIHPSATPEAKATECAAELGGNEAFWKYTDKIFEVTPSNNGLDLATLPDLAVTVGLDKAAFTTCLARDAYGDKVEEHTQDAINAGGTGTPYSVIITANGEYIPLGGAYPYAQLKQIVDEALAQ